MQTTPKVPVFAAVTRLSGLVAAARAAEARRFAAACESQRAGLATMNRAA